MFVQCFNPYKNQHRDFPADVQQPEVLAEVVAEWESGRLMPLGGAKTKQMAATSASGCCQHCCHLPAAFRKGKAATARANSVLRDETNPAAPLHSCSSILEIRREFIYSETRAIASSCWNNYNDLRASPATSRKKGKEGCQKFVSPFRASVQTYYAAIPKPALQGMTAGGRAGLPRRCRRGEVGPCIYTAYGALNKYVELEKSKVLNDF